MLEEKYMDVFLEDDDTPYGGTAFSGETVRDFLKSLDIPQESVTLESLNKELIQNGIKPIGAEQRSLRADVFFIDEDRQTLEWIYYNPDSTSGGQFVENRIELEEVVSYFLEAESPDNFFDLLGENARCFLYDKDTDCFFDGYEMFNRKGVILVHKAKKFNFSTAERIFRECKTAIARFKKEASDNGKR